jgi:NhaP-type Na+/H+ or K+/H+ antiporter
MHGLMLGTILGGSSSIIIMPAMAQARVEPKIGNLVSLESALTDAFCVVGTTALIDVIIGAEGASSPALTLARSFGIGLALGLVSGLIWLLVLKFLHSNEHAYPVTLAALLILYVVVERFGGSAAFGILTCAIVLGNARTLSTNIGLAQPVELDSSVRGFHRQMAFIIKSFFFVFIGAMLGPPWGFIALGLIFGLILFAVRVPVVKLALLGSGLSKPEQKLVAVSMPRGMAAGVLATLPVSAGVAGTEQLPVAVFACVFTTILVFAVGFPLVRSSVPAVAAPGSIPVPAGASPLGPEQVQIPPPAPTPEISPAATPEIPSLTENEAPAEPKPNP